MNEKMREAFRKAAITGTRQIIGLQTDGEGGYCGIGLLLFHEQISIQPLHDAKVGGCHLCGARKNTYHRWMPIANEAQLLVHLNNDHQLDWLGLAEKMPTDPIGESDEPRP